MNPVVKLNLPILTGALALNLAEKKPLTEHQTQFIDVHRDHLLSLCSQPTKSMYDKYCEMVVGKYVEFSDQGKPPDEGKTLTWVTIVFSLFFSKIVFLFTFIDLRCYCILNCRQFLRNCSQKQ